MSDATAASAGSTAETYTLTLERVFKAPRQLVFDAFTDRERFQAWWGPKGCKSTVEEMDVRVGGAYRVAMHMSNGNTHMLSGTYREIDPPKRLVYSWIWGQGDLAGLEMTITLDFVEHPDGTELRLAHSGLPSEQARTMHGQGWSSTLERLTETVES